MLHLLSFKEKNVFLFFPYNEFFILHTSTILVKALLKKYNTFLTIMQIIVISESGSSDRLSTF